MIAPPRPAAPRARGFTLIELLLALGIFSLIALMAYSAFFIGQRAVVAGERAADQNQRLRMVEELIGRQIRSIVFYFAYFDEDTVPYFVGGPDRLTFVSAAPQSQGGTGLAVVTYQVVERQLILEERTGFTPDALYVRPDDARVQHAVLIDGFEALRFEYLPHDDPEQQWQPAWDAREEDTLPAAVRLTVDGASFVPTQPWVLQVPVMTIAYGFGTDEFREPDEDFEDLDADEEFDADEDDDEFDPELDAEEDDP